MTAYVTGAAGTVAFYATVLCVGVWAAAIKRRKSPGGLDNLILANRDLGLYLGVISLVGNNQFSYKSNNFFLKIKFYCIVLVKKITVIIRLRFLNSIINCYDKLTAV